MDCWREDPALSLYNFRTFDYESPRWRIPLSPTRIPNYNDIEDSLRSFLRLEDSNTPPLAIVAHSQGGLIVQRFLASAIDDRRGRELSRIRFVMLLACPNEGSEYLSLPRRLLGYQRHPQARDLNPLSPDVRKSRQTILRSILNAEIADESNCPIPIYAYVGRTDNIVKPESGKGIFEEARTIPGGHSTILDPGYAGSLTTAELARLLFRHARSAESVSRASRGRIDPIYSFPAGILDFSGREEEVGELGNLLKPQSGALRSAPVNVYGKPGVGKSAVAVRYAWLNRNEYPDGLIHLNLRGQFGEPAESGEVVTRLLGVLGASDFEQGTLDEQVEALRSLLSQRRFLIVFDNATSERQVHAAVFAAADCGVVVTSRNPLSAIEGVRELHIGTVSPEGGLALLESVSGRQRDARGAMKEIVDYCGRLPLALRIAGALLKAHPDRHPSRLAERLRGERDRLGRLKTGDLDVESSFALSLKGLTPAQRRTLHLMSVENLQRYDARLVSRLVECPLPVAEDQLDVLIRAQLVDEDERGWLSLHDLVRLYAAQLPADNNDGSRKPSAVAEEAIAEEFVAAYLSALRPRAGTSRVSLGHGNLPLDAVYVDPHVRFLDSAPDGESERVGVRDFAQVENTVVLGGPGSGKTAFANRLLMMLAQLRRDNDPTARVPIFAPLREWSRGDLPSFLAARLRAVYDLDVSAGTVSALMREGELMILADGLDEVLSQRRLEIAQELNLAASTFPSARFIVFQRDIASTLSTFDPARFRTARIEPFDQSQALAYLQRINLEFGLPNEQLEQLLDDMNETMGGSFTINPLMLHLAFESLTVTRRLPKSSAAIYERFVLTTLERDVQKGFNLFTGEAPAEYRKVVGLLALRIMRNEADTEWFSVADVLETAREAAVDLGLGEDEFSRRFLLWVDRLPLVQQIQEATYAFQFPGVRDFFAADELTRSSETVSRLAESLFEIRSARPSSQVLEIALHLYSRYDERRRFELADAVEEAALRNRIEPNDLNGLRAQLKELRVTSFAR